MAYLTSFNPDAQRSMEQLADQFSELNLDSERTASTSTPPQMQEIPARIRSKSDPQGVIEPAREMRERGGSAPSLRVSQEVADDHPKPSQKEEGEAPVQRGHSRQKAQIDLDIEKIRKAMPMGDAVTSPKSSAHSRQRAQSGLVDVNRATLQKFSDNALRDLQSQFEKLDKRIQGEMLQADFGEKFLSHMILSPEKFKQIYAFLKQEGGGLFGYLVSNLQKRSGRISQSEQHIACEKVLYLSDAIDERVEYIKSSYLPEAVETKLELARLRKLKGWLLSNPDEVLDAIVENVSDPLFRGLGEVFFLSSLHYANTNIKNAGATVAPEVHHLTSSEKVALVGWSTGYFNGINSALRFSKGVDDPGAIQAFNEAMARYEKKREKQKETPDLQTSTPTTLSEETIGAFIRFAINGLKKLPDFVSQQGDKKITQLKRVILSAISRTWEEENFVAGKPFIDQGIMATGGTAASGWLTIIFYNISPDAPTWKNAKDITLFSIFADMESEVAFLPGTEFDVLTPYDPNFTTGHKIYKVQLRKNA